MTALEKFYSGKTVMVTGHTGFKGAWISLWLRSLGAEVVGYSLAPEESPNLHELIGSKQGKEFIADIRDAALIEKAVREVNPDLVFHLAAQPLVRRSYSEPTLTMETNVMGTIYLLEALRKLQTPVSLVAVTTDKCYENQGWDHGYRETDHLGGHDVYSMSKAACELAIASWRLSFFDTSDSLGSIATARAGNVIGGGDYAIDRIVPDCARAVIKGQPVTIRNPHATRPWQHVLDCLSGYLWLGICLTEGKAKSRFASAFNFGPSLQSNVPVGVLVQELQRHWPLKWIDASGDHAPHEASRLHLSIDKAAAVLGWHPTWTFSQAVSHTADWYDQRHRHSEPDVQAFSLSQIRQFTQDAAAAGAPWAISSPHSVA